ncbi:sensor histidine kinase [Devosia sp. PTR5]|uniref:histidine kinase n=1 Tax=Devosia oryzisoli TaxID=2774138 RepID=A0A927FTA2_9HYPH|nr:ATP-binding protein [Devosia oryzisoli]MBD8065032.1 sensor histidine kinase [Devosia oryzisoli]
MAKVRRHHVVLALAAVLTVFAVAAATWHASTLRLMAEAERQVQDRLTISQRSVESEIERFRYLPGVIGKDERIVRLLEEEAAGETALHANTYLQAVRGMSGADELYVLNTDGLTLAASNWNEPGSFVGHSYGFRPYFQQAMEDGSGRFYAVGVTTGKPGYFLSSRIVASGRTIGVAVAKVDMSPLASTWAEAGELSGLADSDGIIFLAGDPRWMYRPLRPLGAETLDRLGQERRYDGIDLAAALPLGLPTRIADGTRLAYEGQVYLLDSRLLDPEGWQLLSAIPLEPVERVASLTGGVAALLTLMLFALFALYRQRRQITRMRLEQNAVLEQRVAERTRALAHEVEERRRAEAELRDTQESLVHAAKLAALGRMSAAIVHEVSQPLSALDNTLAAADLHAERDAKAEVRRTLASARNLLKRMQRTVKHLRNFSGRREPGPAEAVNVAAVLEAAVEIVTPQARDRGIALTIDVSPALARAKGNAVRLEQVFINLLLNAVEATTGMADGAIVVTARNKDDHLQIEIADSGTGMSEAVRERLFEPFFTTKNSGESLGLGLSITRMLLEEFGGTLEFSPRAGGGTVAQVSLGVFETRATPAVAVPA